MGPLKVGEVGDGGTLTSGPGRRQGETSVREAARDSHAPSRLQGGREGRGGEGVMGGRGRKEREPGLAARALHAEVPYSQEMRTRFFARTGWSSSVSLHGRAQRGGHQRRLARDPTAPCSTVAHCDHIP